MKKWIIAIVGVLCMLAGEVRAQDLSSLKGSKPVRIGGSLSASGYLHQSNVAFSTQSPYGYSLGANLHLSVYGLSIPFYASFNNQESAFSHPFNRYGLSPRYKWAQAHIGYRAMNFSSFTMSNSTFLGAGLELNPRRFRFAAMYGTLQQGDELARISTGIPAYKRRALAMKIGFGTEARHLDFIVMKAKDDVASREVSDSLAMHMEAQENLVLGLKHKLSLFQNKLTFRFDIAGSIFSHDIRKDTLDIRELTSRPWTQKLFTPTISTSANYAGEVHLGYRHKFFGVSTQYRRVMPEYYSLGSAYILNDLEALTLNPYVQLWKNKVALTASIGLQRDNLDGRRLSTNERTISAVNLQFTPNVHWGLSMSYSNFTFEQQVIVDSLYNDSMLINQLNHQLMLAPRYTYRTDRFRHTFMLAINHQIMDNQNDLNPYQQSNEVSNGNLVYDLLLKKSGLHLNMGVNYFRFHSPQALLNRYGMTLGTSFQFWEKKIKVSSHLALHRQSSAGQNQDFLLSNLSINYQVYKKTRLGLRASYNTSISDQNQHDEKMLQMTLSQVF